MFTPTSFYRLLDTSGTVVLGGAAKTILLSQTLGIAAVRSISSDTLLIQVENFSQNHKVDTGQNGLWRVITHGNDLTRLTTEANSISTSLCQFSQNPWSNVSRDGSLYAFKTSNHVFPATDTLAFGRISGGATQTFASISGTQLQMVGWTTM
jgi:eukaryotic-like serine/threonine-protein kinase